MVVTRMIPKVAQDEADMCAIIPLLRAENEVHFIKINQNSFTEEMLCY